MSAPARIGLVVAGVAVAIVLFFVLREDADDAAEPGPAAATVGPTAPPATDAATTGGTPTETGAPPPPPAAEVVRARITIGADGPSGVQRIVAEQGQRVILSVESQVSDHVHVHGYDLIADVAPGRPATIRFRADIPGRFEIELEDRHVQIAQLRVDP